MKYTLTGRTIAINGQPAMRLERDVLAHETPALTPLDFDRLAERIVGMLNAAETEPRIVVEVRGGMAVTAHADRPVALEVIDWDDVEQSEDRDEDQASAEALLAGLDEVWP